MQATKHEEGQGLIEYALILSLVGIVVIAILTLLGPAVGDIYSNVVCQLNSLRPGSVSMPLTDCGSGGAASTTPPSPPAAPFVDITSATYDASQNAILVRWKTNNATSFHIEVSNWRGRQTEATVTCSTTTCQAYVPWITGKKVNIWATGPGGTATDLAYASGTP